MIIVLLGTYGILIFTGNTQTIQPNPISVTSTINCSTPDKSFCGINRLVNQFVDRQDFSDILENQTPTIITCNSSQQVKPFCSSIQNGLQIQLFKVQSSRGTQLLTRNSYIAFFRSYFQLYGPFTMVHEITANPTIQMQYLNTKHTAQYDLIFTMQQNRWKIAYVSVHTI